MLTLLVLAGEELGITEESLKNGDVIKIPEFKIPLIVREVLPMPTLADGTGWRGYKCDYTAYLHINEELTERFTKQKKTSQKLEKGLAKTLKGKQTPGSGSSIRNKGDVESNDYLAEHKYTDKIEYRLASKIWKKITNEALDISKLPLMEIVIDQNNERPFFLILMQFYDFLEQTQSTLDEFLKLFYCKDFDATTKESFLIKKDDLINHKNYVENNLGHQFPGYLFQFKDFLLLGISTQVFQRIFND